MITTNTSGKITDTSEIPRLLAQQISAAVHAHTRRSNQPPRLHRICIPVSSVPLLRWLDVQPHASKLFWADRSGTSAVAAVGAADRKISDSFSDYRTIVESIRELLSTHDRTTRYYGGFRFLPHSIGETRWHPFGAYQFTLPRFELHQIDDHTTLFCNLLLPVDKGNLSSILEAVDRLCFPTVARTSDLPSPAPRSNIPEGSQWQSNVDHVLDRIRSSSLDKAVLARRTSFDFGTTITGTHLLSRLREHTPACFHFLLQTDASSAFIGASPERLFRREGRRIETEAIAGTRPRGTDNQQDEDLARELSNSAKDYNEHRFVRQFVRDALTPFCESLQEDRELSIMKLATTQHLASRFRGELRQKNVDDKLLKALHPTPAVAGYPTNAALETISVLESFDRGWYAAPVGWIGANAAEFAVAIRCGLIEDHRLHLYAGAGIVEGSDPEAEWNELDQKISDFVRLLITPANQS
jgi:menaquinone-specific isochorismate synthase